MITVRRLPTLAGALVCALLATAAVAVAAPYEPNDSFAQANGPLIGGQNYDAAIETSNDIDWYFFNTSAQRQLDIALSSTTPVATSACSCSTTTASRSRPTGSATSPRTAATTAGCRRPAT